MAAHILRLKRTDKSGQHLLVHVSSTGSKHLELKLVGTEHEHLYHAKVQEGHAKALQADSYSGDLQEWKDILKYVLLHERIAGSPPESLQGLETVAAISGKSLTITLRKNIGGITQRLGSIKLEQDDEREEVSPFDWVDTAVANADGMRKELEALQASVKGQQDEVAQLTAQLDELVKAKKAHEEEMVKKFATLLNAKKLKIRDQQRLLAGAKIDPRVAREVSGARGASNGREVGVSRGGKRKGGEIDGVDERDGEDEEDDEEEAFANDDMQQDTPPVTEDEATEDEDDLDVPARASTAQAKPVKPPPSSSSQMEIDDDEPPSRRDQPLPKQAKPAPPAISEDDEETDDEL